MNRASSLLFPVFLALAAVAAWPQNVPSQPKAEAKLCVAIVANMSASSALVDRLTERLSKGLRENKVSAITMESSTTSDRKLHPTRENGEEARSNECDYMLLTQIIDPKTHAYEPQMPSISIGGRVPSIDASDPMGGSSGPVHRDNLQIDFALFRMGELKAVLDTAILAPPSASVSDSFLSAMDRESNRIGSELKKK
jgi:hypothetical protein